MFERKEESKTSTSRKRKSPGSAPINSQQPQQIIVICVSGASGSGKSTLSRRIAAQYGNCLTVATDNFYCDQSHIPLEQRPFTNYDHPQSIEFSLLADKIRRLKRGESVSIPTYDFSNHNRGTATQELEPTQIIIVEGILALHAKEMEDLIDVKIFVDTDQEICKERRINRDIIERGRTREGVLEQYKTTVKPMFDQFVAPSAKKAHLKVKNDLDDINFDMQPVIDYLDGRIAHFNRKTTTLSLRQPLREITLFSNNPFGHLEEKSERLAENPSKKLKVSNLGAN